MTKSEMDFFLNQIGGLNNGFLPGRPPIIDSDFLAVGLGWFDLIHDLIEDLIVLGWDKTVFQIKEKFGGLRFYIGSGTQEIHDRVNKAESKSYTICENCGNLGKPTKGGWIRTLCNKCNKGDNYDVNIVE